MSHSTPTLDVCDAELARLSAADDTIAATLVELDADGTRKLLDTGALTGTTAHRWQSAQARLSELWTGRTLLADTIAAAAEIRGTARRLSRDDVSRLADAVFGNSVELASVNVPLTQRALLGPRQQTTRCSPGQLLNALEAAFDEVRSVLADVAAAWQWQLLRLAGCDSELAALRATTDHPPTELATVETALTTLSTAVACDPLGIDPNTFATTEAALARARAAVTSSEQLRERLAEILAGADQLLADIAELHAQARDLHAQAVEKIAGHPSRPPAEPDATLPTELMQLRALSDTGRASVGGRLLAWQQRARSARDQARANVDAQQAPLSERGELRGRLDAYTAKAARYGLAEAAQLTRMAQRARDLLYAAPCDLTTARAALSAYVNAITAATTSTPGGH